MSTHKHIHRHMYKYISINILDCLYSHNKLAHTLTITCVLRHLWPCIIYIYNRMCSYTHTYIQIVIYTYIQSRSIITNHRGYSKVIRYNRNSLYPSRRLQRIFSGCFVITDASSLSLSLSLSLCNGNQAKLFRSWQRVYVKTRLPVIFLLSKTHKTKL